MGKPFARRREAPAHFKSVTENQLSLFALPKVELRVTARVTEEDRTLASRIPPWIHLGTSSWTFPGWAGVVWEGKPTEPQLVSSGLRALVEQPLFRAASVDRSYYGPLREQDIASYASQLADGYADAVHHGRPPFRLLSKAWEEITTAVFPHHPRYGSRAGQRNPSFLDASRFREEVLPPYVPFARHFGPFVFELTPMPQGALDERSLARRLDAFLSALPRTFRWAFELRNQELMSSRWHDVLRAHGAAHVFNYWTAMPSLRAQLVSHGTLTSKFVVVRLQLPPFARYADKRAAYAPFNRLVEPQMEMRDDVLTILRAAAAADCEDAFVLAGNKAEGCAPLTVRELGIRIARELPR